VACRGRGAAGRVAPRRARQRGARGGSGGGLAPPQPPEASRETPTCVVAWLPAAWLRRAASFPDPCAAGSLAPSPFPDPCAAGCVRADASTTLILCAAGFVHAESFAGALAPQAPSHRVKPRILGAAGFRCTEPDPGSLRRRLRSRRCEYSHRADRRHASQLRRGRAVLRCRRRAWV
jgi:hypothetical protein